MPVNNPTQPITFQDLQDFYGGSHPIGFNEYFRDGLLVPSSRTVVAANSGVSGTVVRTNAGRTIFGGLTISTPTNSNSFTVDTSTISYVRVTQGGRGNHIVNYRTTRTGHPTRIYSASQDDLPTSTIYFRGPAYQSGDGGRNFVWLGTRQAASSPAQSGFHAFSGFTNAEIGMRTRTTTSTTYDVRYTNTTSFTITNISTNHGTISSLAAGASMDFNGVSSNNVSLRNHAAVMASDANSDIPNSGNPIDLNNFRSVTNPTGS